MERREYVCVGLWLRPLSPWKPFLRSHTCNQNQGKRQGYMGPWYHWILMVSRALPSVTLHGPGIHIQSSIASGYVDCPALSNPALEIFPLATQIGTSLQRSRERYFSPPIV